MSQRAAGGGCWAVVRRTSSREGISRARGTMWSVLQGQPGTRLPGCMGILVLCLPFPAHRHRGSVGAAAASPRPSPHNECSAILDPSSQSFPSPRPNSGWVSGGTPSPQLSGVKEIWGQLRPWGLLAVRLVCSDKANEAAALWTGTRSRTLPHSLAAVAERPQVL